MFGPFIMRFYASTPIMRQIITIVETKTTRLIDLIGSPAKQFKKSLAARSDVRAGGQMCRDFLEAIE